MELAEVPPGGLANFSAVDISVFHRRLDLSLMTRLFSHYLVVKVDASRVTMGVGTVADEG